MSTCYPATCSFCRSADISLFDGCNSAYRINVLLISAFTEQESFVQDHTTFRIYHLEIVEWITISILKKTIIAFEISGQLYSSFVPSIY